MIFCIGKTQQLQTSNKIADSFPGMDGYVQAPVPHEATGPTSFDLSKPPKWFKKPVGASFGVRSNFKCILLNVIKYVLL